jgi:hypothetical protein
MGRLRTLECPACNHRFEQYVHTPDEPLPRFCSNCGIDSLTLDASLAAPALAKGTARNVDGVILAMEEGARFRAQKAADMGLSSAEASGLQITDQRDNMHSGETANVPVVNDVTRHMAALAASGAAVGHVPAAQYAKEMAAVASGPSPNAGARAGQKLKMLHGSQGGVTSEAPALETLNPNYQRRI